MSNMIDVGDRVHHIPSDEDWTVAAVKDSEVYWCGWPFGGYGNANDCFVIKQATPEERNRLLEELASMGSSEYPAIAARDRLRRTSHA